MYIYGVRCINEFHYIFFTLNFHVFVYMSIVSVFIEAMTNLSDDHERHVFYWLLPATTTALVTLFSQLPLKQFVKVLICIYIL